MRNIKALYAEIPTVKGCIKGCNDCCGPVPVSGQEARSISSPLRPVSMFGLTTTPTKMCGTCAYSTTDGCSIYESRPFMCRLFGAVEGDPMLVCPHGAKAETPLTASAARALSTRYKDVMRHD